MSSTNKKNKKNKKTTKKINSVFKKASPLVDVHICRIFHSSAKIKKLEFCEDLFSWLDQGIKT